MPLQVPRGTRPERKPGKERPGTHKSPAPTLKTSSTAACICRKGHKLNNWINSLMRSNASYLAKGSCVLRWYHHPDRCAQGGSPVVTVQPKRCTSYHRGARGAGCAAQQIEGRPCGRQRGPPTLRVRPEPQGICPVVRHVDGFSNFKLGPHFIRPLLDLY